MEVSEIPVDKITGSLCRMRLEFDYEKEELLISIKDSGVLDPIKVKKAKGGYVLFAGHRRLDCARELGHKTIRAEVWEGITDQKAALMGFVENINRKDFTPLEEGHAYKKLIEEYGYQVDDLVKPCAKSRSRIYNLLRLIEDMTEEMKQAILDGKMSVGHALILLRVQDRKLRKKLLGEIVEGKMKLDDLEYILYRQKPDSKKNKRELLLDIVEDEYEKDPVVRKLWRQSVHIHRSQKGVKITVEVSGPMDLVEKFEALIEPVKKARKRFRDILGRDEEIP